tara:strand:+ start:524 stop:1300 length:777 start_codon:yes stop_codon:yes gene_type:complete
MITKQYMKSLLDKGTRLDGRNFDEYRQLAEIEYGVSPKSAEGSARVKIGDTEVIAGVKIDTGTPYPDRPDEGTIMVNVELLPLSSPHFESGPPSIDSIELARVTDRGIRESDAIDFKKLCITAGEKIWMVFIDIYPVNADGNLFDAAALAAIAAVKDAKFPELDKDGNVDFKNRSDKGLPLSKTPVSCTVWKLGDKFLVDPTVDEEKLADARLTTVFTEKGDICAMQKGKSEALLSGDLKIMVDLSEKKTLELRKLLK